MPMRSLLSQQEDLYSRILLNHKSNEVVCSTAKTATTDQTAGADSLLKREAGTNCGKLASMMTWTTWIYNQQSVLLLITFCSSLQYCNIIIMADSRRPHGTSEEEPLLGEQGDASLPQGKPLYNNLVLGQLSSYISIVRMC